MANAHVQKFLQRVLLLLFGLQAIFIPVAAAVKEQAQQKIPPEVVQWITIVTAPWPTYTYGVLFLVILMGILMGLLIYQALAKTKIFGEEFGGAQNSIQGGIAVILTLIVIKFLPFSYYLILIALVVLAAAFFGVFTVIKGISSYAGAEDKWKNTITGIGIGVVLIVVGYFLLQMLDEFQRLGVVTGAGALSTQWPGAIAWLAVIAGIIFMVVGFAYGVMGLGGGGEGVPSGGPAIGREGVGGGFLNRFRGGTVGELANIRNAIGNIREIEQIENAKERLENEVTELIDRVLPLIQSNDAKVMEQVRKELYEIASLVKQERKLAEKELKLIQQLLRRQEAAKREIEAIGREEERDRRQEQLDQYIDQLNKRAETLEEYVKKIEQYERIVGGTTAAWLAWYKAWAKRFGKGAKAGAKELYASLEKLKQAFAKLRQIAPQERAVEKQIEQLEEATEQATERKVAEETEKVRKKDAEGREISAQANVTRKLLEQAQQRITWTINQNQGLQNQLKPAKSTLTRAIKLSGDPIKNFGAIGLNVESAMNFLAKPAESNRALAEARELCGQAIAELQRIRQEARQA